MVALTTKPRPLQEQQVLSQPLKGILRSVWSHGIAQQDCDLARVVVYKNIQICKR